MAGASSNKGTPLAGLERTVGVDVMKEIQSCKILLVGAGGIGCELLKNLALCGFQNIDIIDLDTIDVSNLNRQLLFRAPHVGKSKCEVACEVGKAIASKSNTAGTTDEDTPTVEYKYVSHYGNICDNTKFNVSYVSKFDVVLNALDNIVARRRVNRLCLASNVPLVEAGTTGYLGQVNTIYKPANVACYECKTQETQKVYPICTIRSTPSMPVHTIVWSKELYKLLFNFGTEKSIEESMLFEADSADDQEKEKSTEQKQDNEAQEDDIGPSTYMSFARQYRSLVEGKAELNDDETMKLIQNIITALYVTEINKQLDMGRYKAAKKTPTPLVQEDIQKGSETAKTDGPPSKLDSYKSTDVFSKIECVTELVSLLLEAIQIKKENKDVVLPYTFDKDDDFSMRFVVATSNLRSYVFDIQPIQSYYSAKGIAGNIIPAIATTNAIVAGLQIIQVFHILKGLVEVRQTSTSEDDVKQKKEEILSKVINEKCKYINCIRNKTRNGLYLTATSLEAPNPNCFVCRNAMINIQLNIANWKLSEMLEKIIKEKLGFQEPTIMIDQDIIWEEGDDADTAAYQINLDKLITKLPNGGIQHGSMLRIEDFSQDLEVDLCITHVEKWEETKKTSEDGPVTAEDTYHKFVISGDKPKAAPTPAATAAAAAPAAEDAKMADAGDDDDDDDIVVVISNKKKDDNGDKKLPAPSKKRPAEEEENGGSAKRAKTDDDDVIIID